MAVAQETHPAANLPVVFVMGMVASVAALAAGLLAFFVLLVADLNPLWAVIIFVGVAGAIITLWNTHAGLCFTAFAIAPLGIVQHKFAGITLDLPEVLILALFAKELIRFVARRERPAPWLQTGTLLFFGLCAVSNFFAARQLGNDFKNMLQDFRQYTEYIAVYLLVIHRVRTRKQMRQILTCFFLGMTVLAFHGILQRFTGIGIPLNQVLSDEIYHQEIRSGSFYGATPLGAMMLLAIGVGAGLFLSGGSMLFRVFVGACSAVCLVAAVFTDTRASWIAIALCMVLIFLNVRKTKFIIMGTVLGSLVFAAMLGHQIVHRMEKTEISHRERSLLQRVEYYTAAWYIFEAHPIMGLGWGCAFDVKTILVNGHYTPPGPRVQSVGKPVRKESTVHSAYLQLLVRTGLVGLVSFLLFLAVWALRVVRAWRVRARDEWDHNLFVGVSCALMGYLVHAGLENFFEWPVMSQAFWLLIGLTTIMAAHLRKNGELAPESGPQTG